MSCFTGLAGTLRPISSFKCLCQIIEMYPSRTEPRNKSDGSPLQARTQAERHPERKLFFLKRKPFKDSAKQLLLNMAVLIHTSIAIAVVSRHLPTTLCLHRYSQLHN